MFYHFHDNEYLAALIFGVFASIGFTLTSWLLDYLRLKLRTMGRQGGATPYFIGWLLGVPGIVLLVIFLVRGCH